MSDTQAYTLKNENTVLERIAFGLAIGGAVGSVGEGLARLIQSSAQYIPPHVDKVSILGAAIGASMGAITYAHSSEQVESEVYNVSAITANRMFGCGLIGFGLDDLFNSAASSLVDERNLSIGQKILENAPLGITGATIGLIAAAATYMASRKR